MVAGRRQLAGEHGQGSLLQVFLPQPLGVSPFCRVWAKPCSTRCLKPLGGSLLGLCILDPEWVPQGSPGLWNHQVDSATGLFWTGDYGKFGTDPFMEQRCHTGAVDVDDCILLSATPARAPTWAIQTKGGLGGSGVMESTIKQQNFLAPLTPFQISSLNSSSASQSHGGN